MIELLHDPNRINTLANAIKDFERLWPRPGLESMVDTPEYMILLLDLVELSLRRLGASLSFIAGIVLAVYSPVSTGNASRPLAGALEKQNSDIFS